MRYVCIYVSIYVTYIAIYKKHRERASELVHLHAWPVFNK